jgi:hypothetical protein
MVTLQELHNHASERWGELARAREAYRAAARRYLIAELLKILIEAPEVVALDLNAEYEYDDEGGYLLCLSGSSVLADDASAEQDPEGCWTEGLDVEHAAILKLFGIEHVGDGSLTREQLYSLAAQEAISPPTAITSPTATDPEPRRQERPDQTAVDKMTQGGQ